MTQLDLLSPAAAPVPAAAPDRAPALAMIRAAHRRWAAREARVDRIVRIVAPHLRGDESPEMPTLDVLDEIAPVTVRLRGVA